MQKVVLEHNHYLAIPNKREKLRSQRSVQEADRKLIGEIRKAGMQPAQVYEFMKEFYGGADKVPFSRMDCNNEIGRERKKYLESNDAQTSIQLPVTRQFRTKRAAYYYSDCETVLAINSYSVIMMPAYGGEWVAESCC